MAVERARGPARVPVEHPAGGGACTPITDTWWATTSCSSRAMRTRSPTHRAFADLGLRAAQLLGLCLHLVLAAGGQPRRLPEEVRETEEEAR